VRKPIIVAQLWDPELLHKTVQCLAAAGIEAAVKQLSEIEVGQLPPWITDRTASSVILVERADRERAHEVLVTASGVTVPTGDGN
jgi:hypothetical protein